MIVEANLTQCFCNNLRSCILSLKEQKAIYRGQKGRGKIVPLFLSVFGAPGVQYFYEKQYYHSDFFATYVSSWLASSIKVKKIIFSFRAGCGLGLGTRIRFKILTSLHPCLHPCTPGLTAMLDLLFESF